MILINPYYVISNVVYIKPETSFIMIDRSCWNRMVSMIFRGRKPNIGEIKKLKSLCYETYVTYMNTKEIDYSKFNYIVAKLQGMAEELNKIEEYYPSPTNVEIVEISTVEENFFIDNDYIYEMNEEEKKKNEKLKIFAQSKKIVESKITEFINISIAKNEYVSNLVETIGYGRILSILRIIYTDKEIRRLSELEMEFIELSIPFLADLLKYTQKYKYGSLKYYSFICKNCRSVGCHNHVPIKVALHEDLFEVCAEMMIWYDKNGLVPDQYISKKKSTHCVIEKYIELERRSRTLSITQKTDINWRKFIDNCERRIEVYVKYKTSFDLITEIMKNSNLTSKYYDKLDDHMTNYYATIKSLESVVHLLEMNSVSYVNNENENITLADLNISYNLDFSSFQNVVLVNKEQALDDYRNRFFSGEIKFTRFRPSS